MSARVNPCGDAKASSGCSTDLSGKAGFSGSPETGRFGSPHGATGGTQDQESQSFASLQCSFASVCQAEVVPDGDRQAKSASLWAFRRACERRSNRPKLET